MTPWIGISLGDITGIGPEVALKALAVEAPTDETRYLLIGDERHMRGLSQQLGLNLSLQTYGGRDEPVSSFLHDAGPEPLPEGLRAGAATAAKAAVAWLRDGAERCLRGELDALVTAPVNKEAIVRSGQQFVGQTEFLSELAGAKRAAMMKVCP